MLCPDLTTNMPSRGSRFYKILSLLDFFMRFNKLLYISTLLPLSLNVAAQHIKESYIDWGVRGSEFASALNNWNKGEKWSEDDNFFISRVRPKTRFRNASTQVNPSLTETNDKKLIFWVPINNEAFNALPDGVFDSEVFPMWSYITHYGNWSAKLLRIPGNFADVAHKNGVPVSGLAAIPFGNISKEWSQGLNNLAAVGAEKLADYMEYYGIDGVGYNSEFTAPPTLIADLRKLHEDLYHTLRDSGRNPLMEVIWYDGTADNGQIEFDYGLLPYHNLENWGYGDNIRSSLFFNYNWNYNGSGSLLSNSQWTAREYGRSPLDLYCGINLQGKEPKGWTYKIWTLLKDYNLSIGLWGAHSQNMFFESRAEKGPRPETGQRSYLNRVIKWFTGGTCNPVNTPAINNSLIIAADNDDFFGMSKMMSARSALKWNLSEEPFITYFNLGNGKFFNYKGERSHNSEWYNIGIQDYLPTWMWWFSNKFLGRNQADVARNGLKAEFVWDDAWMGGSLIRIAGSTSEEYLHLFKTEFPVEAGDVVTMRYKIIDGSSDVSLVMSAKGTETTESAVRAMSKSEKKGIWIEKKFIIGESFASLAGNEVAMVAINFKNADNLDLRLGEFSIIRPDVTAKRPSSPIIEKAEILSSRHNGFDGKIIFNMPNDKGNDVCHNIDVNTSLFKLYAREDGKEPVLMGLTTSWAGLLFSVPVDYDHDKNVCLGVSAMSLDMTTESEIAWSNPMSLTPSYEMSDKIAVSKEIINPGEPFSVGYVDSFHSPGSWIISDESGNQIASSDNSTDISLSDGIERPGTYSLRVTGVETIDGEEIETIRNFPSFIQITREDSGNVPVILSATVNGKSDEFISLAEGCESAKLEFKSEPGEGVLSRGVKVGESGFGFRFADTALSPGQSFSVSFWLKPDTFDNHSSQLLNIRDKMDQWPNNNRGWFWHTVDENGITDSFTLRMKSGENVDYRFDNTRIEPGIWHHFAYTFDFDNEGNLMAHFFLDGEEQRVTSWSRGDEQYPDTPLYQGMPYAWSNNNVVAVGGFLHNSGSVIGNLDNLMVWNKSLSGDEVRVAMSDIDYSSPSDGLVAAFDFEKDYGPDLTFNGQGGKSFSAGNHDYHPTELEGQGSLYWVEPQYCAGAPMLDGNSFNLTTETSLYLTNVGKVSDIKTTGKGGEATLTFPSPGLYIATLKLENEYGAATEQFSIHVDGTGIVTPEKSDTSMEVRPILFDNHIEVISDNDADYRVSLMNLAGSRILVNDFSALTGDSMRIYPEVPAGVYLLTIEQNGKLHHTTKVIKK